MELDEAIRSRRSHKSYDENFKITDELLRQLFALVQHTPSSFNLQHTRFVVVRDPGKRQRLMEAAWGQKHIGAAPADIVVCAKLSAHEEADHVQQHAPPEVREKVVSMITGIYEGKPQLQRDEAIRSGSLASMTLMLVARSMCPRGEGGT